MRTQIAPLLDDAPPEFSFLHLFSGYPAALGIAVAITIKI
jgi:hypothetical protein